MSGEAKPESTTSWYATGGYIAPVRALPPYSGPVSKCPKCAHGTAETEWMPDSCQLSPWGQIRHTIGVPCDGPGWLQRRCERCRYQWAEATEDARVQA